MRAIHIPAERRGATPGILPHIRGGRVLESIELHSIPQLVPLHLQQVRRAALVATRAIQGPLDDVAFDAAQGTLRSNPPSGICPASSTERSVLSEESARTD